MADAVQGLIDSDFKHFEGLPVPFAPADLPRAIRADATALWAWYDVSGQQGDAERLAEDARRVARREPPSLHEHRWRDAVSICKRHGLDAGLLAPRLESSALLAQRYSPETGPDLDGFAGLRCGAHARLLARLAGLKGSWQGDMAEDLGRGFFLTYTVVRAPRLASAGHVMFPGEDLQRSGVSPEQLEGDRPPAGHARLLWKQAVRARDALAAGRPLIDDMPRLLALRGRGFWMGALELLLAAEKSGWDVWAGAPRATRWLRFRSGYQAIFGRTAFRGS